MNSYYSIIYAKINSLTDEKLAVAILFGGGEGPFFYLSQKRLSLMQKLVDKDVYMGLKRNLKQFEKQVNEYRLSNVDLLLFDPVYSEEELNRISKLSEGMLLFSEPTTLNDWLDEELFKKLTEVFLNESPPR